MPENGAARPLERFLLDADPPRLPPQVQADTNSASPDSAFYQGPSRRCEHVCLGFLAMAARQARRVLDPSEIAQRYFDWAQQLRDRAEKTTNPKIRRDRPRRRDRDWRSRQRHHQ